MHNMGTLIEDTETDDESTWTRSTSRRRGVVVRASQTGPSQGAAFTASSARPSGGTRGS